MDKPVLAILAAGLGSRYGGLKQIDVVGNNGESIIDFSIYDAYQAGFRKVILIIRPEHEAVFEAALGHKIRRLMEVEYSFQTISDLSANFTADPKRVKPWGTTQALLTLKDKITGPFMIINADDYYGRNSFKQMYEFLTKEVQANHYGMVAYTLNKTLSLEGTVSRAICETKNNYLQRITEIKHIKAENDHVFYQAATGDWLPLAADLAVSMNYWGFTPAIFAQCEQVFYDFLQENIISDPLTAEHVIPTAVGTLLASGKIQVKLMTSTDQWFGVTYQSDKENVVAQLLAYKEQGLYPFDLWQTPSITE